MTESEWLSSSDPAAMLHCLIAQSVPGNVDGLVRRPSDRKLRLFACACRRQLPYLSWGEESGGWAEMEDRPEKPVLANGIGPHTISALEHADLFIGGRLPFECKTKPDVAAAILRDIVGDPFKPVTLPPGPAAKCKACKGEGWRYPGSEADDDEYACAECKRPAGVYGHYSGRSKRMECPKEDCPACGGKGTIAAPCLWLTPEVLSLATAAYTERGGQCSHCQGSGNEPGPDAPHHDYQPDCRRCRGRGRIEDGTLDNARLAVLSDALEEAGAFGEILAHLRSPGRHWRGMWSLDLVLGKE